MNKAKLEMTPTRFLFFCGVVGFEAMVDGGPRASIVGLPMSPELHTGPYFLPPSSGNAQNVTVYAGQTAFLQCRVQNLGGKKVSWVRHEGVSILVVGRETFTSDRRISARYNDDDGRFSLKIRRVTPADEGTYECQISTKPTKVRHVRLSVLVPKAVILGEKTLLVERNSKLNLTCIVNASTRDENVADVQWYKDGERIVREGADEVRKSEEKTLITSYLRIANVRMADSGNYTCASEISQENSTVKVHVLAQGVNPDSWKTNCCPLLSRYLILFLAPLSFYA